MYVAIIMWLSRLLLVSGQKEETSDRLVVNPGRLISFRDREDSKKVGGRSIIGQIGGSEGGRSGVRGCCRDAGRLGWHRLLVLVLVRTLTGSARASYVLSVLLDAATYLDTT
jgi:hypothetical protein